MLPCWGTQEEGSSLTRSSKGAGGSHAGLREAAYGMDGAFLLPRGKHSAQLLLATALRVMQIAVSDPREAEGREKAEPHPGAVPGMRGGPALPQGPKGLKSLSLKSKFQQASLSLL